MDLWNDLNMLNAYNTMMLDDNLTYSHFGYHSRDLSWYSTKKVVAICDTCNKPRIEMKRAKHGLCRSCIVTNALKLHPQPTGKDSPFWKGGLPKCVDCGKQLSKTKYTRCVSCSKKGEFNPMNGIHLVGENNGMYGKNHTHESLLKMSLAQKGKIVSEDTKRKLSESLKGKVKSKETRLKLSIANTGKKHTEETKRKMSERIKGKNHPMYGKHCTEETKQKLSIIFKGVPRPDYRGENCGAWKGGISPLGVAIRATADMNNWKQDIFRRDDYTCQECYNRGGYLEAHHITPVSKILQEFLNKNSNYDTVEDRAELIDLSAKYEPFYDMSNGITLCKACHKDFHKMFGKHEYENRRLNK